MREEKEQNTCRPLTGGYSALLDWTACPKLDCGMENVCEVRRYGVLAVEKKKRVRELEMQWVMSVHSSDDYTARYKDLLLIFYGGHRSGLSCHHCDRGRL